MRLIPFNEVQDLEDKQPIEGISGIIKSVQRPQDQTPSQKEYGYHNQRVCLAMQGGELWVTISHAQMHMDPSCKGKKFIFESTPGENGKLSGVTCNRYLSRKEEREVVDVEVSKYAQVYEDTTMQEAAPEVAQPTAATSLLDTPPFDFPHWRAFLEVMGKYVAPDPPEMRKEIGGALLQAIKEDRILVEGVYATPKDVPPTPPPQEPSRAPDPPTPKVEETGLTFKGSLISELDGDALATAVITVAPYEGDNDQNLKIKSAVLKRMVEAGLSWDAIYDRAIPSLVEDYGQENVNRAYDYLKEQTGLNGEGDLERSIIFEFSQFSRLVEEYHEAESQEKAS